MNIKKNVCLFLTFLFSLKMNQGFEKNCNLFTKNYDDNTTSSIFSNFETIDELLIKCAFYVNFTDYMGFIPSKPFLIDKSFSIKNLFMNRSIAKLKSVTIINIFGIDIEQNFLVQSYINSNIYYIDSLRIMYSKFNIYSKNVMVNSTNCKSNFYDGPNHFLNSFLKVIFIRVSYPKEWCPYFFKSSEFHKSSLVQIYFGDISNSFLYKNRLNFIQLNDSNPLNGLRMSNLKTIVLFLNYEILTPNILCSSLFVKIRELVIDGVLNGIEEDALKKFEFLQNLDFGIDNFKDFFHNGNNRWMRYLNFYVRYNSFPSVSSKSIENNLLLVRFQYPKKYVSFENIYDYPDEDLCLFKDFPHERLVYPILNPGKNLSCTCTLFWLQSYSYIYLYKVQNISNYDENYQLSLSMVNRTYMFCSSSFEIFDCDKKIKNCKIQSINLSEKYLSSERSFLKLNNDRDFFFLIKWLQFILLNLLQPIFCITGMITNLFTIFVIKNKAKEKEFKHAMYQCILLHSFFNIIYCMIISFKLINTCIFFGSSPFCSNIYLDYSSQRFKIIFIFYLGNVFKMCSNLSYLSFTVSRLIVITFYIDKAIPPFPIKNLVLFFFFFLFSSLILNLFKLFQFAINVDFFIHEEFPYEIRNEVFCQKMENQFQCRLFNGFKISHRILNDLLFVVLNMITDLVLLKRFRIQMDAKARQVVDLDHHKRIRESKSNINRLVLTNSFIYILSHMPEFISSLLLVVYSKKIANFCKSNVSCDLINEEAEFFGLIAITGQFFVFIIFDKNFKNSLNELSFLSYFRRSEMVNNLRPNSTNQIQTIELTNLNRLIGNGLID